jgi:hypothetical protein
MIEYRFKVHNTVVFTLYSYSKALEYPVLGGLPSSAVFPCAFGLGRHGRPLFTRDSGNAPPNLAKFAHFFDQFFPDGADRRKQRLMC